MKIIKKIKLFAVDTDGVLMSDSYSPAIEIFVKQFGGIYTADVERGVWGSPQLAAGQNLALACKLPWSGKDTIERFFEVREEYLKDHPVRLYEHVDKTLEMLKATGAKITSYGGRDRQYTFDKFLNPIAEYFDKDVPYVDVNPFRPGVKEIVKDIFKLDYDEVVFIDDINRVAEVAKALGAGFIGIPASMKHNFQREEMVKTGVRFTFDKFSDITEQSVYEVDELLSNATLWR